MQTLKPLNCASDENILTEDEFNSLLELFIWLKTVRDNNYTQPDTLEPNNNLNNSEFELQQLVG